MIKKILPFLTLLIATSGLFSQIPDIIDIEPAHIETKANCSHLNKNEYLQDGILANPVEFRPYDVLNYNIFLDWYDMMNKPMKLDSAGFGYLEADDVVWTGRNTITLRIDTSELSVLEFDSRDLEILKVTVNGNEIIPIPPVVNNVIKVTLDEPFLQDDTVDVTIEYKHSKWLGQNKYKGFYLYPKRQYLGKIPVEPNDSAFVEERLAYTMSEPQNARYWLPSNDAPHDKATVSMNVRVPEGYSVASNGLLKEIIKNDTAWTYHWQSKDVMTTYLIHAAASVFKEWSEWYKKVTNPDDSIEVKYFTWQKDYDADSTNGSQYNARWTFEQNIEQIEAFSTAYGEYPFEKYGIVALQPFGFGGMEHQTMTSINRVWLRQNARWGLAHELAHMWLGDYVTCKTWNDIWVNEGGATWSEAIWSGANGNFNSYLNNMLGKRAAYFRSGGAELPPIYGLPINTIFGKYAVLVYQKSSWIYHQLRMMLGDDVFFPALRSLLAKNALTSIDHTNFIKSFSEDVQNPPIDFDTYFNQWLMKQGHPQLSLSITTHYNGNDNYLADISISQIQEPDDISDIFEVPIRLVFKDDNDKMMADTVWQYKRNVQKQIELPFFPTEVYVDTTFTLCEILNLATDVRESSSVSSLDLTVAPNPLQNGNMGSVTLGVSKAAYVRIEILNILGQMEKEIYSGYLENGTYHFDFQSGGFSKGTYLIRVFGETFSNTEKLIIY